MRPLFNGGTFARRTDAPTIRIHGACSGPAERRDFATHTRGRHRNLRDSDRPNSASFAPARHAPARNRRVPEPLGRSSAESRDSGNLARSAYRGERAALVLVAALRGHLPELTSDDWALLKTLIDELLFDAPHLWSAYCRGLITGVELRNALLAHVDTGLERSRGSQRPTSQSGRQSAGTVTGAGARRSRTSFPGTKRGTSSIASERKTSSIAMTASTISLTDPIAKLRECCPTSC